MARVLQTTGPAANLTFCIGIDDDNSTIKVFKSTAGVDHSGTDNTALVNSSMTVNGGVSVGTTSWNGHTVPYFVGSGNAWVTFGTNKPHITSSTGGGTGVMSCIAVVRTPTGASNVFAVTIGNSANFFPMICEHDDTGTMYCGLFRQNDGVFETRSTANAFGSASDETWAFVHRATAATTQVCYLSTAGTALALNNSVTSSQDTSMAGDIYSIGGDGGGLYYWTGGRVILVAYFDSVISQTDLAAIHADPYGTTLFQPPPDAVYFPGVDITASGWTTSTGSGTLSSMVDESTEDDTDFIESSLNPTSDVAELKFLNVQTPNSTANHVVSYSIKGDASTNMRVDLVCGTTIIKTWTHNPAPTTFTRYDQTLTSGEAATITDYSNLRLRLTAG